MADYGHELTFGTFITPTNIDPEQPVRLARLTESAGLDLVTFQDHPYQATFLDTWTLLSWVAATTERVTTVVTVPFVALPPKPGRNVLQLPPVPVAVARASGEVVTVCTRLHTLLVEDPIANEVDPKVRPNPEPRPQREDWALARQATIRTGPARSQTSDWVCPSKWNAP